MNDKEKLNLLNEYNFHKILGRSYPNYLGFGNARVAITANIDNIAEHRYANFEERYSLETLVYSEIGFMLSKYVAHPTENLQNRDDPDSTFLICSEKLTFRLAKEIDAYMEALYSGQDVSKESVVYKNIMSTINRMEEIDHPSIADKIFELEKKLKMT